MGAAWDSKARREPVIRKCPLSPLPTREGKRRGRRTVLSREKLPGELPPPRWSPPARGRGRRRSRPGGEPPVARGDHQGAGDEHEDDRDKGTQAGKERRAQVLVEIFASFGIFQHIPSRGIRGPRHPRQEGTRQHQDPRQHHDGGADPEDGPAPDGFWGIGCRCRRSPGRRLARLRERGPAPVAEPGSFLALLAAIGTSRQSGRMGPCLRSTVESNLGSSTIERTRARPGPRFVSPQATGTFSAETAAPLSRCRLPGVAGKPRFAHTAPPAMLPDTVERRHGPIAFGRGPSLEGPRFVSLPPADQASGWNFFPRTFSE